MTDRKTSAKGIAENLKKGITELLILSFLDKKDMHIHAIINDLDKYSKGACKISYPYAAIYRLSNAGFITEQNKQVDDNRLRQFYKITASGRKYLKKMRAEYDVFMAGVSGVLDYIDEE